MTNELIVIVMLIVVGGGIAYLGDWIGLTMGKRRLSLFGLRPRHTARVFTVTSGAIIAVGTFLMLVWLDANFRIAVREGAQIVHRNHVLNAQNRRLEAQTASAVSASQTAIAATAAAIHAQVAAETQYQSSEKKLSLDKVAIAQAAAQLSIVSNQLAQTSTSLAIARTQLADAKAQTVKMTQKIALDESFVNKVLIPRIGKKEQDAPIYGSGQEIGRTVIRSDQTVEEIKQKIRGFLLHLSVLAQNVGAARGANGRFVEVATVEIVNQGKAPTPQFANEAASVSALADQISAYDKSSSVVVIARALGNAFASESVVITLRPYANHLVITQGSVLAQVTVPVSDDNPNRMLADLQQLLQRSRESAIHAGVIPVQNPQANESEIGETNIADLFTVVEQIRAVHGPAVVTAAAAQDTYSADRLHLNFTVSAASSEGAPASGT